MDLKKILDQININADWIGLREVKETTTYRIIRDLNPESNNTSLDHAFRLIHIPSRGRTKRSRSRP